MAHPIRVIQYGLGPIGNRVTRYLCERPTFRIVGAIDIDPGKVGRDVGELAGLPPLGTTVCADADTVLREGADVVVLTTTSSLEKAKEQILRVVSHGLPVVSTCEELSYPWHTQPAIAEQIDRAARERGVAVLGTGVNPGFLMDLLPIVLTAICQDVRSILVERFQDAQYRRLPFQRKIGAGLTVQEFQEKVRGGTLRHVGLTESMHMIASRMGWNLDRTEDIIEPVVATERVVAGEIVIEPGYCLGVNQTGHAYRNGREVITLRFRATIGEPEPRDRIRIEGTPTIDSVIPGGVNGDIATCAITVNALPVVMRARPGLRTMADIEPVTFFQTLP
jgi:4-hydroxy-tetrahydrodipicolinate reductase